MSPEEEEKKRGKEKRGEKRSLHLIDVCLTCLSVFHESLPHAVSTTREGRGRKRGRSEKKKRREKGLRTTRGRAEIGQIDVVVARSGCTA